MRKKIFLSLFTAALLTGCAFNEKAGTQTYNTAVSSSEDFSKSPSETSAEELPATTRKTLIIEHSEPKCSLLLDMDGDGKEEKVEVFILTENETAAPEDNTDYLPQTPMIRITTDGGAVEKEFRLSLPCSHVEIYSVKSLSDYNVIVVYYYSAGSLGDGFIVAFTLAGGEIKFLKVPGETGDDCFWEGSGPRAEADFLDGYRIGIKFEDFGEIIIDDNTDYAAYSSVAANPYDENGKVISGGDGFRVWITSIFEAGNDTCNGAECVKVKQYILGETKYIHYADVYSYISWDENYEYVIMDCEVAAENLE